MRRISDANGAIMADTPKISPILAILLPIILPKANSALSSIAVKQVNISGIDVAIETTVNPTIKGLILK